MKAIVVRQPWASLIALGIKTIETRPCPPNGPMRQAGVRGLPGLPLERGERIAIVAGKTKADVSVTGLAPWQPLMDPDRTGMLATTIALGAVVCTVAVAGAVPVRSNSTGPWPELVATEMRLRLISRNTWAAHSWSMDDSVADQLPLGDFAPGRWGWMLTDRQRCEPIPCKGQQGVFALPDDVAERLP